MKPIRPHQVGDVSQKICRRRWIHADVGRAAWAADLFVIGIQMRHRCGAVPCTLSVGGGRRCTKWTAAAPEQIHVAHRIADWWQATKDAATYILCPTSETWPKAPMSSAIDDEGLLQLLQQDVLIDDVKGCRQDQENQSTQLTTINGLWYNRTWWTADDG